MKKQSKKSVQTENKHKTSSILLAVAFMLKENGEAYTLNWIENVGEHLTDEIMEETDLSYKSVTKSQAVSAKEFLEIFDEINEDQQLIKDGAKLINNHNMNEELKRNNRLN